MADGSVRFINNRSDPNALRTQLLRQPSTASLDQNWPPQRGNPVQAEAGWPRPAIPRAPNDVNQPPKSAEDFAALVSDLDSGDLGRRMQATRRLLRAKPSEPNAAVAKALERVLLEEKNTTTRVRAALALANWGTAESIAVLQEAAQKDSNALVRSRAAKAIEAIKLRQ
jgi:hypothetical protein